MIGLIGLVVVSIAMGSIFSPAVGFITFGAVLMMVSLLGYLNNTKSTGFL